MNDLIEFQRLQIEALRKELESVKKTLLEISEVSTAKARNIKVILADENFNKPLNKIKRNYE